MGLFRPVSFDLNALEVSEVQQFMRSLNLKVIAVKGPAATSSGVVNLCFNVMLYYDVYPRDIRMSSMSSFVHAFMHAFIGW